MSSPQFQIGSVEGPVVGSMHGGTVIGKQVKPESTPDETPSISQAESDVKSTSALVKEYSLEVVNGLALILNYVSFDSRHKDVDGTLANVAPPFREGSDKDAEDLRKSLQNLSFKFFQDTNCTNELYGLRNGTSKETLDLLDAMGDHVNASKYDCLIIVVASHGMEGVFATYNEYLNIEKHLVNRFDNFNCPKLAGKPKLFFIQACQGDEASEEVVVADAPLGHSDLFVTDVCRAITIPAESDILISYATVPGNISTRSRSQGSSYLQALSLALDNFGDKLDVQSILTIVCKQIGEKVFRVEGIERPIKQCTIFISRLRHLVKFIKKSSKAK